ncbi:MAG: permease, partial [Candidatus Kapaibacterium sp.]
MSIEGLLLEILDLFIEMSPYIFIGLVFVGILHIYFKKDLVVRHIGKNNLASVIKSSIFGVPLPLCSCGVVPTSVYMARNGASKGSVVSFLTSTPQTGIDSIIATYGLMGWIFAIFRPVAAFMMGIIGGGAIRYMYPGENRDFVEKMTQTEDKCDDDDCTGDDCGCEGDSCGVESSPAPRT